MSADADDADGFVGWLSDRGTALPRWEDQFVPRFLYGEYLGHLLNEAGARSRGLLDLEIVRTEVLGFIRSGDKWIVTHARGTVKAARVVLATGTDLPSPIGARFGADVAELIIDNPWTS